MQERTRQQRRGRSASHQQTREKQLRTLPSERDSCRFEEGTTCIRRLRFKIYIKQIVVPSSLALNTEALMDDYIDGVLRISVSVPISSCPGNLHLSLLSSLFIKTFPWIYYSSFFDHNRKVIMSYHVPYSYLYFPTYDFRIFTRFENFFCIQFVQTKLVCHPPLSPHLMPYKCKGWLFQSQYKTRICSIAHVKFFRTFCVYLCDVTIFSLELFHFPCYFTSQILKGLFPVGLVPCLVQCYKFPIKRGGHSGRQRNMTQLTTVPSNNTTVTKFMYFCCLLTANCALTVINITVPEITDEFQLFQFRP